MACCTRLQSRLNLSLRANFQKISLKDYASLIQLSDDRRVTGHDENPDYGLHFSEHVLDCALYSVATNIKVPSR